MTDKRPLKIRLLDWLSRHPEWHASGNLQRMAMEQTNYTAQNVGRRLRELQNEGLVKVNYRRGHAWYRAMKQLTQEEWFEELGSLGLDGSGQAPHLYQ
jgi:DNA-binding transcriptional ArsR family regulator